MGKCYLKWMLTGILIFFAVIGFELQGYAKQGDASIEGFIGMGFGPKDKDVEANFGSAVGAGAGFGYEVVDNLQLRTDFSFYKWSKKVTGVFRTCPNTIIGGCGDSSGTIDEELSNIPIFLGGRYLFRVNSKVTPFVDFGLSVNFLNAKQDGDLVCSGCIGPFSTAFHSSGSVRATNIGVVPGFGILFMLSQRMDLGVTIRYHLIQEGVGDADGINPSFATVTFLTAYRF